MVAGSRSLEPRHGGRIAFLRVVLSEALPSRWSQQQPSRFAEAEHSPVVFPLSVLQPNDAIGRCVGRLLVGSNIGTGRCKPSFDAVAPA